jgi:hypothetical protein
LVIVLDDDPLIWLDLRTKRNASDKILVILPSNIVVTNFERRACKEGLPLNQLDVMTFETVAHGIVKDAFGLRQKIMDSQMLLHYLLEIISKHQALSVFSDLPLGDRDTLEVIVNEYDDYLRCSNIGRIHNEMKLAADNLASQYAKQRALDRIEAFSLLNRELQALVPRGQFQTRNHLIEAATSHLQNAKSIISKYQEVVIAGVTVFDAMVYNLIKAIDSHLQPDSEVHIFVKRGLLSSISTKFGNPVTPPNEEVIPTSLHPSTVTKNEVPDRRREVMLIAKEIRKRIKAGVEPSGILIVANTSGTYLPLMKDIFPAFGIPFFVQTRRPYVYQYQYRMLQAFIELVSFVESNRIITWQNLVSPLRLGFCDKSSPLEWPIDGKTLLYLEERLSWKESDSNSGLTYNDWKNYVTSFKWKKSKSYMQVLFDSVDYLSTITNLDPKMATSEIKKIWASFVYTMALWVSDWRDPRLDEQSRFQLLWKHPTSFENRITNNLDALETYLEETHPASISWADYLNGFSDVVISGSYGIQEADLGGVSFVDAGNTWFRKAKLVFLLGMKSEEFPRKTPRGTILSDQYREAIEEHSQTIPEMYVRTAQNDYENEWDKFLSVLSTVESELLLTMPYLDERGHSEEWSSFAEELSGTIDRIPPDEWLPPRSVIANEVKEQPIWVRWQLYSYHFNRAPLTTEPSLSKKEMRSITAVIEPSFYEDRISPRIDRYTSPPETIIVEASEPWFVGGFLDDLVGPPYRVHELDLHGSCPFIFYFYQFLYNLFGDDYRRDIIPPTSRKARWRYGPLPIPLRDVHLDDWTDNALCDIINNQYSQRDQILTLSAQTFITDLRKNTPRKRGYRLAPSFQLEYEIISQEQNMQREWKWVQGGQVITIVHNNKSIDIVLPSHRIDTLAGPTLVSCYVRTDRVIGNLLWNKSDLTSPKAANLTMLEHLLPVVTYYYETLQNEDLAGAFLIEAEGQKRDGYFAMNWQSRHRESVSRYRRFRDRDWSRMASAFQASVVNRASSMTPDPDITYAATRNDCFRCVYRTLCLLGGDL